MKHTLTLLAAAAALAFAAAPAGATIFTFSTTMTGAAESPPAATNAGGSALVSFDDVANSVTVLSWFFDLTAPVSAAHIHCCTTTPLTGTAGVALDLSAFPPVASGSYGSVFTLSPASLSALLNGALAGKSYVNLHTSAFPDGEIRGFLGLVSVVPEPSTYALMLGGLAAVGALARRRRLL